MGTNKREDQGETRHEISDRGPGTMSAQEIVRSVGVRPLREKAEIETFDALMRAHHYLGLRTLVGECLRYVAEVDGRWVALLAWAAPALKIAPRDTWIGWDETQQRRRLRFVADNTRFLILPGYNVPNLATRVLSLNLRRLSRDFETIHGHPVVLAETFVDPSRFQGTIYRAGGWTHLGETRGFARSGASYVEHKEPKQIYVRPLVRRAQEILRAPFDAPELSQGPGMLLDVNRLPLDGEDGLMAYLLQVPDPRMKRGVRHSFHSILAISVLAVLCGARSFLAIADFAQGLSPETRRRLGCFRSPTTGKVMAPSEPTIRRALTNLNADRLDDAVGRYLQHLTDRGAVAIDGKTLRGSRTAKEKGRHLLSAVHHVLGVVLAQREVGDKTNEIPLAREVLGQVDLEGRVVTADALHTQKAFAAYVVGERKAEYVLTVKENQPQLRQGLLELPWDFSPSVHRDREGTRTDRETEHPGCSPDRGGPGVSRVSPRRAGDGGDAHRRACDTGRHDRGNGLRDHEPQTGTGRRA